MTDLNNTKYFLSLIHKFQKVASDISMSPEITVWISELEKLLINYSSNPNKRVGPNKGAGWNFDKN